jgi:hypothetical protein
MIVPAFPNIPTGDHQFIHEQPRDGTSKSSLGKRRTHNDDEDNPNAESSLSAESRCSKAARTDDLTFISVSATGADV